MYNAQGLLAKIAIGATVFDSSGEKIGSVTEINELNDYIRVQRGWLFHKDFYVPFTVVDRVDELGGVILTLNKQDLDDGFDVPPILGKTTADVDATAATDQAMGAGVRTGAGSDTADSVDEDL